ncbi:MAG TPA: BMP family ABC transporter substrate-binding protein [Dictyoglomaceae bacterium]|nr:BMP family ABC transporter substrate-binding protein [Dictyoglomaceae bacterium]HOL40014.1 BMP family ABC transporter substrate-binding protein [Dictyoglomaceae bacterium]HOP95426.1 BMP family ABC transporter substrate-binding protein [Dictyoglomaceae bacterium]HPP15581.1 BMP family ABC transporter substrate-binding protein [Dictyoglomaceae bacterium]HPU42896.1 BMP family ABC transporter substrate-binding protein [Dictyoglomaceae bacterium]
MRKSMSFFLVLFLVLLLSIGFSAKTIKVGLVYDIGGRGDKSFNDAAYAGLQRAISVLKVEGKDMEPGPGGANREELLRTLAEQNYDLVIGVGFLFTDAIAAVAKDFPKVKFAIVDGVVEGLPNVSSLVFNEHEGSFLVGIIAGLMTKSNVIGFVGGMDMPLIHKFEVGYKAGAMYINPKVKVLINYIGVTGDAFKDPVKAKELALAQYKQGADIIYHASGASGEGVFEAAKETKKYAIGVDSAQSWIMPDRIITSMLKRVDVAVFETIKDVKEGKFKAGVRTFGLSNKGVDYEKTNLIPLGVRSKVESINKDIISGKIVVPYDDKTFEEFKAKYLK